MTTTTASQDIVQTVTIGTLASTLAAGAFINFGTAGEINNAPGTLPGTVSGDLMDLFVNFGTIVTTGTGTPQCLYAEIDSLDGTNFVSPGTTAAAMPAPQDYNGIKTFSASTALSYFEIPNIPIGPYKFLSLLFNNTGTPWPIGTTVIGVIKTLQNG